MPQGDGGCPSCRYNIFQELTPEEEAESVATQERLTKAKRVLTNRQKNGLGCIVVAVVLTGVAVKNSIFSGGISPIDPSGLGVSRMVGAFLPAILVLAFGLWLMQKPKA